jgi:hypothetical protein
MQFLKKYARLAWKNRNYSLRVYNTERQVHGLKYEAKLIEHYGLLKQSNYTAKYDAIKNNIPIQIKCIKYGGAIEMGDYMRNKQKQCDFILLLGLWNGQKDNIIKEHIFNIDYRLYIDNLVYDMDEEMIEDIKKISNCYSDDRRWKIFCEYHRYRWKQFDNKIDLRFKRDHKKQKRIQCAISWGNFNNWFKEEFQQMSSIE